MIGRNLREKLEEERAARKTRDPIGIRFITLTLKHSDQPLVDQLRRLTKAFKTLRNTPEWNQSQDGGAAILEIKWSKAGWHAHFHIVSAGRFLDRSTLSNLWRMATGDSFIVDIRSLNDVADACHYVVKYITKGVNTQVWDDPAAAQEYTIAMRGVRVCNTFGTWRGFRLTKHTCDVNDWKPVCSLTTLLNAVRKEEAWALALMMQLRPPGTTYELPPAPPDSS